MSCGSAVCSSTIIDRFPAPRGYLRRPHAFSLRYWVAIVVWRHARWRQRQALLRLDDRMLADIGISRAQAIQEAKKSFWK
jgi:uncharacterized protein YjiS (DUF1127 family)